MLNEERRQKIQEILTLKKRILVKEVSRDFNISEVTIRKDLEVLEKRGILSRVHGGAILKESTVPDIALTEKEHIHPQEKQKIAQKAAELIERGDVIILDSGSTTTQIARLVKFKKDLKIITNAVNIALELAASDNEVILTGGFLREKSFSLVGSIAEEALRTMTVDKLFLGVDGIHFQYGLTTPNLMEGRVNRLMMKIAHEVIVVADSSKFGKRSMSVIAGVEEADTIITDKKINNEDFNRLRELGVEAILV
jgi:DeoR family transcriptional regulator of aga operon